MADRWFYMPLGGAGEIGMNMYVYGYGPKGRERLLLVDAGVTFPDMDSTPGVDLIMPDFRWIAERRERLEAIFVTHAHEDHLGAIASLLEQVDAQVYARRFTAEVVRRKVRSRGFEGVEIREIGANLEEVSVGPFNVRFLPVSHSVPESSALVIDTPAGRLIHTGDFKIDDQPFLGGRLDLDTWSDVARDGLTALVCDSTNVFSTHQSRSESSVGPELFRLMNRAEGAVAATTFASNIARLKQLAEAGIESGRSVVLLGRAINEMIQAALETGTIGDFPGTIMPDACRSVPRRNLLLLATGSQGEIRAASSQLASGNYRGIRLSRGDTFLFSSKTIPGNEKAVARIMNALSELGVQVVDDSAGIYHVSGHANRPDLTALHKRMKPDILIPMHGEHRHLVAHADLAALNGLDSRVVVNGQMLDLQSKKMIPGECIEASRLYLDGNRKIGSMSGTVRDRLKMAREGFVSVSIVLDADTRRRLSVKANSCGLPLDRSIDLDEEVSEAVESDLRRARRRNLDDDSMLEGLAVSAARRTVDGLIGKKPKVGVVVHRL